MTEKAYAYIGVKNGDTEAAVAQQKKIIEEFCRKNEITNIEFFIIPKKNGITNTDEYKGMLESISKDQKHARIFLAASLSRVTRSFEEWFQIQDDMNSLGVKCYMADSGLISEEYPNNSHLIIKLANQRNPELDLPEEDALAPILLQMISLDDQHTALVMSDNKIYYVVNDEVAEQLAVDFNTELWGISSDGRKIVMRESDWEFKVSDIFNFMNPLDNRGIFERNDCGWELEKIEILKERFRLQTENRSDE